MDEVAALRKRLAKLGSPEKAVASQRFFKVADGQYGAGDVFIGVTVPEIRKTIVAYRSLPLSSAEILLQSPIHEERLAALLILVWQFTTGDVRVRKQIYDFYLTHTKWVNNWDLVDSSAEYIVGPWLQDKDKQVLVTLAHSPLIWERRIAMLATFHYIKQGQADVALEIISLLLDDDQDLIQKATGWMLREIGKRCDEAIERAFLDEHYRTMPRTTLRYAVERFPVEVRAFYMAKR